MKVILTERQFKDYIKHQINEKFDVSLTQHDMPKEFKQINKDIYGDVDKIKIDGLKDYWQANGLKYKDNSKDKKSKKHGAKNAVPEIKGRVFPFGNIKLSDNVLIVNMTTAFNCPSAKFCPIQKGTCYAYREEQTREDVFARNARNEMMFDQARENPAKWRYIFWFLRKYIETSLNCGHIIKYLRLNEAGDFKTGEDIKQFDNFAEEIKRDYGIITHAYTANVALKDYIKDIKNINVNASVGNIEGDMVHRHFYGVMEDVLNALPDTPLKDISTPVLNYDEKWKYYYKCPCDISEGQRCYNCQVCWLANPGVT